MQCQEVRELAAAYAIGALDEPAANALEAHLRTRCEGCVPEVLAMRETAEALASSAAAEPPVSLRQRLLEKARSSVQKPGLVYAEDGVTVSRSEEMAWKVMARGVEYKELFDDPALKQGTRMVRMKAGAKLPRHRHHGSEEVFLLSGDIQLGKQTMQPGDHCHASAGSLHEEIRTESGCVFLLSGDLYSEVVS